MNKAEQMYEYCIDNNFGKGISKKWAIKHFDIIGKNLMQNEQVLMCFCGLHNYLSISKHDGYFAYAITDKRIMISQKKIIGEKFQSISLKNVNDVTFSSGVMMGIITVDTFKEKFNVSVDKKAGSSINSSIHDILFDNKKDTGKGINDIDSLIDYKKLLDSGVINQEEFDLKKKQLLNL